MHYTRRISFTEFTLFIKNFFVKNQLDYFDNDILPEIKAKRNDKDHSSSYF